MRTLEDLAQERLNLSSQHNSNLHKLLCDQQIAISDVSKRSRMEIDSILNAQSIAGSIMLDQHQQEMGNIENQIRQLKKHMNHQQTTHKLTTCFDF